MKKKIIIIKIKLIIKEIVLLSKLLITVLSLNISSKFCLLITDELNLFFKSSVSLKSKPIKFFFMNSSIEKYLLIHLYDIILYQLLLMELLQLNEIKLALSQNGMYIYRSCISGIILIE